MCSELVCVCVCVCVLLLIHFNYILCECVERGGGWWWSVCTYMYLHVCPCVCTANHHFISVTETLYVLPFLVKLIYHLLHLNSIVMIVVLQTQVTLTSKVPLVHCCQVHIYQLTCCRCETECISCEHF